MTNPATIIGPDLAKRWIGHNLTMLRKSASMAQQDAADRLQRATQQHIAQLESAQRLPKPETLQAMLALYGADYRLADFVTMLAAARSGARWWTRFAGANSLPKWFEKYLGLEAGATHIAVYSPLRVPDLLQTETYTNAAIRCGRAQLQLERQYFLQNREPPAQLTAVIDESVLHRRYGIHNTMLEQLTHLAEMSEQSNIEIQILPFVATTQPIGRGGAFTLLTLPAGLPSVVCVEALRQDMLDDNVEPYQDALRRLRTAALDADESRRLLKRMARTRHA